MQARTPRYWIPAPPSKLALMGIRFMVPPPDPGPTDPPTPPAPTPPAPTPAPAPAPTPAPTSAPAPAAPAAVPAYDPDYAHRLREEARVNRERYERAERERDEKDAALKDRDAKLAARDAADARRERGQLVERLAKKDEVGGDVDLILDSSKWADASKDLDWSKEADVEKALTKFVTDNPRFKTAPQGPGSSGPIRPNGTGTPPRRGGLKASLDAAVASGA